MGFAVTSRPKRKRKRMNKMLRTTALAAVAALCGLLLSCRADKEVMQKEEDGSYVINTTKLRGDVIGYEGETPLKIYITAGKVTRIEPLPNRETPRYFARVKTHLLPQWYGMEVSQALKADVDGVTGATYSSRAVKENVRRGLEYYKKHKR